MMSQRVVFAGSVIFDTGHVPHIKNVVFIVKPRKSESVS